MGWGLAVVEERTAAAAAAARTGSEVQRRRNGCWKQNMGCSPSKRPVEKGGMPRPTQLGAIFAKRPT
jgi:hypothetical protein